MKKIESIQNPKIKDILKLDKPRERKARGVFIAEGFKEIKAALDYKTEVVELFYCEDFANKPISEFQKISDRIIKVSPRVFAKISYREKGDGFLAVVRAFNFSLNDINTEKENTLIVLDNVEKPGNLGAVIRTAVSANFKTVIVNDMQTDIFNPNVVRASLGALFGVKLVETTKEETKNWLNSNNYKVLGTSAHAKKQYTQINYNNQNTAIIFGSEDSGLSDFWKNNTDELITIPIEGEISSLNISNSAAIILYEAKRQKTLNM